MDKSTQKNGTVRQDKSAAELRKVPFNNKLDQGQNASCPQNLNDLIADANTISSGCSGAVQFFNDHLNSINDIELANLNRFTAILDLLDRFAKQFADDLSEFEKEN